MTIKFVWDDKYSVNDPEIDEQHKFIFSLGNRIQDLTNDNILDFTLELHRHYKRHFEHEEDHMRKSGFPQLADHIKLHDELINKFSKLFINILDSKNTTDDLQNLLHTWITDHILNHDIQYFNYYRNRS